MNPGGITKTRTSIGFDACFVLFPAGNVSLLTIHAGNKTKKAAPRPFLVFVAISSQRGRDAPAIARANSGGAYGCARHRVGEFRRSVTSGTVPNVTVFVNQDSYNCPSMENCNIRNRP